MTTLLSLSDEIAKLDAMLGDADNADAPAVQEALTRLLDLTSQRADKVNAYCSLIRELELRAQARLEEAERLREAADRASALRSDLHDRLLLAMKTMDIQKVETTLFTVTRAKNGGKAPLVIDEAAVPDEYVVLVESAKIDKERIREELEKGAKLSFARLGERGESVRIR